VYFETGASMAKVPVGTGERETISSPPFSKEG